MRKCITTGMAVAMPAIPSIASADVTNNPSTSDSYGYATANANRHVKDAGWSQIGYVQFRLPGAK